MNKPDETWNCKDCKFSTISEYYMVQKELWKHAVPEDPRCLLCIACLEKRIGRELKPEDFTDCPLNEINKEDPHWRNISPLLQKRLRGSSAE